MTFLKVLGKILLWPLVLVTNYYAIKYIGKIALAESNLLFTLGCVAYMVLAAIDFNIIVAVFSRVRSKD